MPHPSAQIVPHTPLRHTSTLPVMVPTAPPTSCREPAVQEVVESVTKVAVVVNMS